MWVLGVLLLEGWGLVVVPPPVVVVMIDLDLDLMDSHHGATYHFQPEERLERAVEVEAVTMGFCCYFDVIVGTGQLSSRIVGLWVVVVGWGCLVGVD